MGIFKNDDQKSSQFGFDEKSMAGKAVKAVRWIYAITGVLALIAGIALPFAPAKSLVFLTTVLGFYFVITAAIRLFTAIFEPLLPTGWRVTSLFNDLVEYEFEGERFLGFKDFDCYLSLMYGDYMTLPPVDKRITHGLKAWRINPSNDCGRSCCGNNKQNC